MALLAGLGCLGLLVESGGAVQNIKWGTTEIHPYFLAEEYYDDNIYLLPQGSAKKGSWVNVAAPGLYIRAPFHPRYEAHLDMRAQFLSYAKDSSQNNDFERLALADALFKFPRQSSLRIYNNFQRTSDQAESEFTQRAKRIQNDAGFTSDINVGGRLGVSVDGQHTLHRYEDDTLKPDLDRMEYVGGGGLFYRLFPKTRLLAQYHYDQIAYAFSTNTNDSRTHSAEVGVKGQISPKMVATILAGAQWRHYDEEVSGAPQNARTGSYSLNLEWQPDRLTLIKARGLRSLQESVFGANRYYVSDAAVLEMNQTFGVKWEGNLLIGFEHAQYPVATSEDGVTDTRIDKTYQAGFELNYKIQPWLSVGGRYYYRQRDSNFPLAYKDNITGVTLRIKL